MEALLTGEMTAAAVDKVKREREESGGPTCPAEREKERAKATTSGDARMLPTHSGIFCSPLPSLLATKPVTGQSKGGAMHVFQLM